jgi:hypothetical protein
MHSFIKFPLSVAAFAIFTALTVDTASGQAATAARAKGEAPSFDDILSPEIGGGGGARKNWRPRAWLEVEAKINVDVRPVPPSKTLDRMTVKWYVAVGNPDKAGTFLLLTKDVEHVSIPIGEDIYSSVYLSPASLRRLTGSDRGSRGAVEMVGYEVIVNGEKVAEQTSKGQVGWWAAASDRISRSDSVPLLNKLETPFAHMWWDRYAEVLSERR